MHEPVHDQLAGALDVSGSDTVMDVPITMKWVGAVLAETAVKIGAELKYQVVN